MSCFKKYLAHNMHLTHKVHRKIRHKIHLKVHHKERYKKQKFLIQNKKVKQVVMMVK